MASINKQIKRKQVVFALVILVGIILLGMFATFLKKNKGAEPAFKSNSSQEIITHRYDGLSSSIDERAIWMSESSNKIDDLQNENRNLQKEIKDLKQEFERELKESLNQTRREIEQDQKDREIARLKQEAEKKRQQETKKNTDDSLEEHKKRLYGKLNQQNDTGLPFNQKGNLASNQITRTRTVQGNIADYHGDDLYKEEVPDLVSLSFNHRSQPSLETPADNAELNTTNLTSTKNHQNISEVKKASEYIPAGSFFRGILIGGVDAPTGGQSQQDPHPVLIKVDDLAQLPNSIRFDVKECHVVAAAHGDISSERAIIRLETMSCIDQDENVHEATVKGFAFGEDGKSGVRGRLVEKRGQLLMNSLLAGIGAGMGKAFQQQATTYSTSPLGSTSIIESDKIAMAGIGTGVGTALDRLSQYYINLAEQLFPVVEVDAGRSIDLVLTSGFSFKHHKSSSTAEDLINSTSVGREVNRLAISTLEKVNK